MPLSLAADVVPAQLADLALALWRAGEWPCGEGIDPWLTRFGLGIGQTDPFSRRGGVVSGLVRGGQARIERTADAAGKLVEVALLAGAGADRSVLADWQASVAATLQREAGQVAADAFAVDVVELAVGAVLPGGMAAAPGTWALRVGVRGPNVSTSC
ncbi:hypothetical protein [Buchananella hordeovulneris]|uniref:hypothetical protein n=1 Tax=Buchananella hordeovulneris TaxID=52770 RepID=UPI0026DBB35A|nr:hypothetical protein [Buchananella hordeovulneris]MDO5081095.1 hypothetical protein [Buchananella hordeovulneris]